MSELRRRSHRRLRQGRLHLPQSAADQPQSAAGHQPVGTPTHHPQGLGLPDLLFRLLHHLPPRLLRGSELVAAAYPAVGQSVPFVRCRQTDHDPPPSRRQTDGTRPPHLAHHLRDRLSDEPRGTPQASDVCGLARQRALRRCSHGGSVARRACHQDRRKPAAKPRTADALRDAQLVHAGAVQGREIRPEGAQREVRPQGGGAQRHERQRQQREAGATAQVEGEVHRFCRR